MLLNLNLALDRIRDLQGTDSENSMAKRLGISQSVLNYTLTGKRKLSLSLAYTICDNYDVSLDWLLGRTDERTPSSTVAPASTVRPTSAARSSEPTLADLQAELKSLTRRVAALEFALSSEDRRPATAAG